MNGRDPADDAEDLRAREYLASLGRRERNDEARRRALVGNPAARKALAAKFAPLKGQVNRRG